MAGGTDILVQLRSGRFNVDRLIDVKKIPEMNELSYSETDGLFLGAAGPCCKIYENNDVCEMYPGVVDAAFIIGGIQIQGRASIGGNLCNASPSADAIPALVVLGATCLIEGPNGRRELAVEDFCTGPGKNALDSGEILVALKFPPKVASSGAHYLRFIPRNEMDIAVAGVGAWVSLDEKSHRVKQARIALSAVGPTPIFAKEASDILSGLEPNEESFELAAQQAQKAASPIDDMRGTVRQRVHLVGAVSYTHLTLPTSDLV